MSADSPAPLVHVSGTALDWTMTIALALAAVAVTWAIPWAMGLKKFSRRFHLVALVLAAVTAFSWPGMEPKGIPGSQISILADSHLEWSSGITGGAVIGALAAAGTTPFCLPPSSWFSVLICLIALLGVLFQFRGVKWPVFAVLFVLALSIWIGITEAFGVTPDWMRSWPVELLSRWGIGAGMICVLSTALRIHRESEGWPEILPYPLVTLVVSGIAALAHLLIWPVGWGNVVSPGPLMVVLPAVSLCFWFAPQAPRFVRYPVPFRTLSGGAGRAVLQRFPETVLFWMLTIAIWLAFFASAGFGDRLGGLSGWGTYLFCVLGRYLSFSLACLWYRFAGASAGASYFHRNEIDA